MADPVVHITNGVPDSGTGNITTLGQTLTDGANATMGITTGTAVVTDAAGTLQQYLRGIVKLVAAAVAGVTGALFIKAADGSGNLLTSTTGALDVNIKHGVNANSQATMANSAPVVVASNQSTLAVAHDTSQLANGASGTYLTPARAVATASTSGATTLVALVSGKKIRILSLYITANGAVNFNFQSHTTTATKTGLTYCAAAGDGMVLPYNPLGWFDTVAGEALDINLSGAVAVDGYIVYVTV